MKLKKRTSDLNLTEAAEYVKLIIRGFAQRALRAFIE
jgi:hypothetical protein